MLINRMLKDPCQDLKDKKRESEIDVKPGLLVSDPEYCFNGLKTRKNYIIYY